MSISKINSPVLPTKTIVFWTFISILAAAGIIAGCDQDQRHKVLTFFFEQVPPPGYQRPDPNTVANNDIGVPANIIVSEQNATKRIYSHEPIKDCKNNVCHGQQVKGQWSIQEFSKDVPELCYDCHQKKGWGHGPAVVGDCLFCHNPHKSVNRHLLNDPSPVLCFKCHDETDIKSLEQHQQEIEDCTICHYAHAESGRKLLRQNIQVE